MKKTFTKGDLIDFDNMAKAALQDSVAIKDGKMFNVSKNLPFKVFYAVQKTIGNIKPVVKEIQEALLPQGAFKEYNKKREEICKLHAEKEANGEPKIVNGTYAIAKDNKVKFQEETVKLGQEYRKAIEENAERTTALQEEIVDVELHALKESDVPANFTVNEALGKVLSTIVS